MSIEHKNVIKIGALTQSYDDTVSRAVHDVIESLPERRHQSDKLVGSGRHRHVFDIKIEGKDCVLKLMHDDSTRKVDATTAIKDAEQVALATHDLDHFEKIVAASVADRLMIAEKVEGETLKFCTVETIREISDEHIREFLDEAVKALDRGVMFDPNPSNLIYDSKEGFTAIDVSMKANGEWPGAGLAGLFNIGADNQSLTEGYEFDAEKCKAALLLLEKLQRVASGIPEIDRDFFRQCRGDIYANKEALDRKVRKRSLFLRRLIKR